MIHPRRLKGTPTNLARYYTIGDYYSKGSDEHSEWGGKLAAELGLEGKVDPARFEELLSGKVGDQQLGRRRKEGVQHHPGWDFAVNAPKSVSIMALVHGDERIVAAHERAVGVAISYLEENAELRRRVEGEIVHETTGRLLFARFTEHSSRELDPHLHTHVVVMNMTNTAHGEKIVSLETRAMFTEQMVAGQVYRNELAYSLREIGYEVEFDPRRGLFEIRGVPEAMVRDMSQRAEQIEAHAREHGHVGQAQRAKSFYATRRAKEKVGLDDLHARWTDRARPWQAEIDRVSEQVREKGEQSIIPDPRTAARAVLFGIRQTETHEAVNNLGRYYRTALASHVGEVRLGEVRPLVAEQEARIKLLRTIRQTGDQTLLKGRTSLRTVRLELALSEHLSLAMGDAAPAATPERLVEAARAAGLTEAQSAALNGIALGTDRLVAIQGVAGSGKSTLVGALVQAVRPDREVIALAPTSSAAADLGAKARIESRTVADLLATGGRDITDRHILVLDEAGQLGNRQAMRMLEISRHTGALLILIGDTKQTGAIEQGKAFWLLQKLGMPTNLLTESRRQETDAMKDAVSLARKGDYAASLGALDRVTTAATSEDLAKDMVAAWTRLKPSGRAATNILVLDNATRLIVNTQIRETLKREGVVAAEDARLSVLTSSGMSDQEKHNARFYSGGQVVSFGRDIAASGIARDAEYRVLGVGRDANGRQIVRLIDENGRIIRWDPRLGNARQINVFNREERDLSEGDRIQWRLANKDLQLKNAERGTVEKLDGPIATIRWDRDDRRQDVDLSVHKTWDHGYAETVYSAQSKTYDRVYVLAPVNSGLVNGQNYYTAITRAQYGVKLWTEDPDRLAQRLAQRSGAKTSSLEGLGRLDRDSQTAFAERHPDRIGQGRDEQDRNRQERRDAALERRLDRRERASNGLSERLTGGARSIAEVLDRFLQSVLDRGTTADPREESGREDRSAPTPSHQPEPSHGQEH